MRLLAKRNPSTLVNIRNKKVYNTTEFVDIRNIKIRCKQLSVNIFEILDQNNVSPEKQFPKIGTRKIRKSK